MDHLDLEPETEKVIRQFLHIVADEAGDLVEAEIPVDERMPHLKSIRQHTADELGIEVPSRDAWLF